MAIPDTANLPPGALVPPAGGPVEPQPADTQAAPATPAQGAQGATTGNGAPEVVPSIRDQIKASRAVPGAVFQFPVSKWRVRMRPPGVQYFLVGGILPDGYDLPRLIVDARRVETDQDEDPEALSRLLLAMRTVVLEGVRRGSTPEEAADFEELMLPELDITDMRAAFDHLLSLGDAGQQAMFQGTAGRAAAESAAAD